MEKTRVWASDWINRLPKTIQRPALCACATNKQPAERNGREPTVAVRFVQVLSCLCLGGCSKCTSCPCAGLYGWLSALHVWTCACAYWKYVPCLVTSWTCKYRTRLPHTNWAGAGGILSGPKAPPDSATANSLVLQSRELDALANFSL